MTGRRSRDDSGRNPTCIYESQAEMKRPVIVGSFKLLFNIHNVHSLPELISFTVGGTPFEY